MSEPIIEQIAEDIKGAISEITTANGYQQNLVGIRPTRRGLEDGAQVSDGHVLVMESAAPEPEERTGNPGWYEWLQMFELHAVVLPSDTDEVPIGTYLNRVRSDIEKKLRVDPQRSTLAIDTRMAGATYYPVGPEDAGVTVDVIVLYRTRDNDPYA